MYLSRISQPFLRKVRWRKIAHRNKRRVERIAMRKVSKTCQKESRELLSKFSRQQLLDTFIPEVGNKKKKKKKKQGKKVEGESKKVVKAAVVLMIVALP